MSGPNRFSQRRFSSASGWQGAMRYAPVTLCLIAMSFAVMIFSHGGEDFSRLDFLFFSSKRDIQEVANSGQSITPTMAADLTRPFRLIEKGEVWRLITPIFLHFGLLHLIFNGMWIWQFGLVLETRYGSARFALMVGLLAIFSNVAEALGSGIFFGGLSGVSYGLLGYLLAHVKLHPQPFWTFPRQTVGLLLAWLVLGFTGLVGPVANLCHLGGLLCGFALGAVVALRSGAWQHFLRRQQFRQRLRHSDAALHRCCICASTELTHPELGFYVHPSDQQEYCEEHLPPLPDRQR
jgi:GlpG protein